MRFEFRAEAFNVLQPSAVRVAESRTSATRRLVPITSTVGNPRQLQMGVRFQF